MEKTINIKPVLTELGKKRLLENNFKISKFSLADDGINYRMIDGNLQDPTISLQRTPVFKTWKDSTFNLHNKLLQYDGESSTSYKNFMPKISSRGEDIFVHPKSFTKEINFPHLIKQDDNYTLQFYITSNDIAKKKKEIKFSFDDFRVEHILNVVLSESIYFDIKTENNSHINFNSSQRFSDVKTKFPKVLNINCNSEKSNYFYLKYRGNFNWTNIKKEIYETSMKFMDEKTGQYQVIKLQIIPRESVTDTTPAPAIDQTISSPDPITIESVEE